MAGVTGDEKESEEGNYDRAELHDENYLTVEAGLHKTFYNTLFLTSRD